MKRNSAKIAAGTAIASTLAVLTFTLVSLSTHHLTRRGDVVDFASAVTADVATASPTKILEPMEANADVGTGTSFQYPDALATDPVRHNLKGLVLEQASQFEDSSVSFSMALYLALFVYLVMSASLPSSYFYATSLSLLSLSSPLLSRSRRAPNVVELATQRGGLRDRLQDGSAPGNGRGSLPHVLHTPITHPLRNCVCERTQIQPRPRTEAMCHEP